MLTWFEGRWVGEVNGEFIEETWSVERDGQRHGMFRWHKGDKPALYEWMLMGEFDGRVQIRIKHFGADGVGWEEKNAWTEFTLAEEQDMRAEFHQTNKENGPRMFYHRIGDEMRVWFEREGTPPSVQDVLVFGLAGGM
jgi:hypothetical protein